MIVRRGAQVEVHRMIDPEPDYDLDRILVIRPGERAVVRRHCGTCRRLFDQSADAGRGKRYCTERCKREARTTHYRQSKRRTRAIALDKSAATMTGDLRARSVERDPAEGTQAP